MSLKSIAAGILFMLIAGFQVQGQILKKIFSEIEFIGGLGTTNYFGDVGGEDLDTKGIRVFFDKADIDLWQTRMALSTGLRVSNSKKLSFSMLLSPVFLSGNDERSKYAKEGRHYSFKTTLLELSLQGEYYLTDRMTGFAPYCFAGLGGIMYSINYTENTLIPEPKQTKWYPTSAIILGLGGRLPSKGKLIHTFDFGFHFTTTDFLDGYKTSRETPDLFIEITYKINYQLYNSWYLDHKGLVR